MRIEAARRGSGAPLGTAVERLDDQARELIAGPAGIRHFLQRASIATAREGRGVVWRRDHGTGGDVRLVGTIRHSGIGGPHTFRFVATPAPALLTGSSLPSPRRRAPE